MTGFLLAVTALVATIGVLTALIVWRLVRRARIVVAAGRRHVLDLQTRVLAPGPRRDAAQLRRRLADEVRALRVLVAAAPGARIFSSDAATLQRDITGFAVTLDTALAGVASLPGRDQQQAALTPIAAQAQELIDTFVSARETMLRTAALDRDRTLHTLHATVAHEAAALSTYERTERGLTI